MNSLKQALIQLKADWKNSLFLGCTATLFVLAVRFTPYVSALLISFGLLFLQEVTNRYLTFKAWPRDLTFLKENALTFLITSLILLPTSTLLGSAIGVLESPQDFLHTIPMSWGLLILAVYFYLVLAHALRMTIENGTALAKAVDIAALASLKNFREYFIIAFYMALAVLISGILWGAGFIVTLPVIFYAAHYSFLATKERGLLQEKRTEPAS
ncbi:hypothetical protein AB1A81_01040 [Bdellovibrio bacteriovorus]|uniref:DUF4013 domain-containing protein n=1 Tax=Bdellovibrio bacteriovorus (strain ATCC 15356 / DSM 50701 / NCIMB 9529 / HD100) TaxID=264462 RepID=Q6MR72_BDEBA|nr:hypothetical protein [Bdellovibrio bacteriovorus]AHZ85862.1 hypothetical protein EP01_13075 [Bdellovibrio bacteriovorus]BEV66782.1 hypothetical protein Bb109J_c0202 [Bdellovibrio bacteriovorus]CAE77886.1 hypothetical protein predicted by Glimmer/Critica [Bdellovibrio bacteriovorus HD100]